MKLLRDENLSRRLLPALQADASIIVILTLMPKGK